MPDPKQRPQWERQFSQVVRTELDKIRPSVDRGPLSVNWPSLNDGLKTALVEPYREAFIAAFLILWFDKGLRSRDFQPPNMTPADVLPQAQRYAETMAGGLAGEITTQTAASVRGAVDGSTGEVVDNSKVASAFGLKRIERIGVTETTRTISAGELAARDELQRIAENGIIGRWITERDAKVCPICRPLDGKAESIWAQQFPDGPPAHPNCRCTILYEVDK